MIQGSKRQGRVIRRYVRRIAVAKFEDWKNLIRGKAHGCGLYALYDGKELVYVGKAGRSIKGRIEHHIRKMESGREGAKYFTHFSVFLVPGVSGPARTRRIQDLEALLLTIVRPKYNRQGANFAAAGKLKKPLKDR